MPRHGIYPSRHAAGTPEIFECWFDKSPIRRISDARTFLIRRDLIRDEGKLADMGARSFSGGNATVGSQEATP